MIIYGKNSVSEIIRNSPEQVRKIMISDSFDLSEKHSLNAQLKKFRGKFSRLSKNAITDICGNSNHQGIAAEISDFSYSSVNDLLTLARKKKEKVFILILDHLEDPHNLGAIVRTADFFGLHGIVIPDRRACEVTPTVVKISSGASANIKIARETNLGRTIDFLKKQSVWVAGADADCEETIYDCDFAEFDLAVVIGNEGKGIGSKTRKKCDFLFSIPKKGKVESLNASVAAAISLYEIYRQRESIGPR